MSAATLLVARPSASEQPLKKEISLRREAHELKNWMMASKKSLSSITQESAAAQEKLERVSSESAQPNAFFSASSPAFVALVFLVQREKVIMAMGRYCLVMCRNWHFSIYTYFTKFLIEMLRTDKFVMIFYHFPLWVCVYVVLLLVGDSFGAWIDKLLSVYSIFWISRRGSPLSLLCVSCGSCWCWWVLPCIYTLFWSLLW